MLSSTSSTSQSLITGRSSGGRGGGRGVSSAPAMQHQHQRSYAAASRQQWWEAGVHDGSRWTRLVQVGCWTRLVKGGGAGLAQRGGRHPERCAAQPPAAAQLPASAQLPTSAPPPPPPPPQPSQLLLSRAGGRVWAGGRAGCLLGGELPPPQGGPAPAPRLHSRAAAAAHDSLSFVTSCSLRRGRAREEVRKVGGQSEGLWHALAGWLHPACGQLSRRTYRRRPGELALAMATALPELTLLALLCDGRPTERGEVAGRGCKSSSADREKVGRASAPRAPLRWRRGALLVFASLLTLYRPRAAAGTPPCLPAFRSATHRSVVTRQGLPKRPWERPV